MVSQPALVIPTLVLRPLLTCFVSGLLALGAAMRVRKHSHQPHT